MTPEEFIKRVNQSITNNQMDNLLLSDETRFLRGKYLLKIIENVLKVLKSFDFKDTITFEDNIAYIKLNGIN